MTIDDIKAQLKKIFADRLDMDIAEMDVSDDAPLFGDEGWGIDSIDVIDIVLGIEATFNLKIRQDEEVQKHFSSLNALAAHLQDLMA